jgi:hypothetical protein
MNEHEPLQHEPLQSDVGPIESGLSSPGLIRLAGLASILGGVLFVLPMELESPIANVAVVAVMVGALIAGLIGVHLAYRRFYGRFGKASVVMIVLGLVMAGRGATVVALAAPNPEAIAQSESMAAGTGTASPDVVVLAIVGTAVGLYLVTVGSTVLGIVLWRRRLLPRAGAALLLFSFPAVLLGSVLGGVSILGVDAGSFLLGGPFGLAMVVLGRRLLTNPNHSPGR